MSGKRTLQASSPHTEQPYGDPDSPYLLSHEAAQFLRFNTPALFVKWAKRNRIPVAHRGRTLLYRKSVLIGFVEQRRRHGATISPFHALEQGETWSR